ncbi:MAG: NAD(P)H-hydrate epimerase [Gemmobacter sp.]|uniref:NAD(P)H-hydrate epimerase n=1 Tax=Gemmobacter sp. TaxID=1898957 RepID=UPI00391B3E4D
MTEVLISAQMRAIERAAIDSGAVTGLELMERAGQGVVGAILAELPDLARGAPRAVVLCGPGNNGGDGFVVARLLTGRGWAVRVLAAASPEAMPPDAAENARRWLPIGPAEPLTEDALRSGPPGDLYVDAIFGTGLSRAPAGELLRVLTHLGGRNGDAGFYTPRLVAVDAPSVLCLDSGRSLYRGWDVPRARLTVTFDSPKAGHLLAQGPALCGKLVVADIGLAPWRAMEAPHQVQGRWSGRMRSVRLGRVAPVAAGDIEARTHPGAFVPAKLGKAGWSEADQTHKFTFGHALVLSGGCGQGGAARLAARGALRIGAGLVTVGCPPEALAENAARLDAVMLRPVVDGGALADVLVDKRITALCLGPGLGTGAREVGLVAVALGLPVPGGPRDFGPFDLPGRPGGPGSGPGRGKQGRSVVLDADALTILGQHADLFAALHPGCVLTPHAGEFARLFPDIAAKLAEPATKGPACSKVDATREAAARSGCVVLFKGPDTVIADPSGRCAIHAAAYDRSAPWLATAGSGDVLAGFIAGLLARGLAPFDAACTAAWLHVEAARTFGPGLIAEDLPEQLPAVFRALGV